MEPEEVGTDGSVAVIEAVEGEVGEVLERGGEQEKGRGG